MPLDYCTFYIVRHGETQANVEERMQGHIDAPLTPKGIQQAKEVSKKLQNIHFDEVFSSDLPRAIKTAEFITLERNIQIKTTQALREKTYGSFDGRKREELLVELRELFEQFEALQTDTEKLEFKIYHDGESDNEAATRFITHLRELAVAYPGKTLLIASHGGIMRYFLIKLGWGSYSSLDRRSVKNTAYIKVESDGVDFFVKETFGIIKSEN